MRRFQAGAVAFALISAGVWAKPAHQAARPTFLYVHDAGTPNRVFGYALGAGGALTPVPNSPFDSHNAPGTEIGSAQTAAYSAQQHLLFTTGLNGLSVFRVAIDGSLTLVDGSPFFNSHFAGVAVGQTGEKTFIYASEPEAQAIEMLTADANGVPSRLTDPNNVGPVPAGMEATSKNLFFVNTFVNTGGLAQVFKVHPNGSMDDIDGVNAYPKVMTGATVQTIAVDPAGRYYYIPDRSSSKMYAYRMISGGKSIPIVGSPFDTGVTAPNGLDSVVLGNAPYWFALASANGGQADVQAFRRKPNGIVQKLGVPQSSGIAGLAGGTMDPTGAYLFLVDDQQPNLISYSIAANGTISPVATVHPGSTSHANAVVVAQY